MKKILIIFLFVVILGCGQKSIENQDSANQRTEKERLKDEEVEESKTGDEGNKAEEIDPKYSVDDLPEIKLDSELIKGEGERMFVKGGDNCTSKGLIGAKLAEEMCGPSIVEYSFEVNDELYEHLSADKVLIGIYPFQGYKEVYKNFNWEDALAYEQQHKDDLIDLERMLFDKNEEDEFYSSLYFGLSGNTVSLNNSKFVDVNNIKGGRQVNGSYGGVEVMLDKAAMYKYYGITEDKKYLIILTFTDIYSPAVDKFTKENDEKIDKLLKQENFQNDNSDRELNMKAFNEMKQKVEEVYINDIKDNNTIPKLKKLDELVKSIEIIEK